jgi:hypothetical protein
MHLIKYSWLAAVSTYHLHVPMSRNLGALTSWNPVGLFRPVMGQLLAAVSGGRMASKTSQFPDDDRDGPRNVIQSSHVAASSIIFY